MGVTADDLRRIVVDPARLEASAAQSELPAGAISGVIVALVADSEDKLIEGGAHVVSRFFGPWMGIAEDPVTGSAHSVLGPYVSDKLGVKPGSLLGAKQLSQRGGCIGMRVPPSKECVEVSGQGVLVIKGEIYV